MFIDKQTITKRNKIRKLNYINFANIGNVWAPKEAKLTIRIAFFSSQFMQGLEFRF